MIAFSFLFALSVAPGIFTADAPETFRDMTYSGVQLGRDRDKDIKSKFKTERGAVRPDALKLITDRPRDYRADVLLDGRGGDAVVRAIRVEYSYAAPTIDVLTSQLGEAEVMWPKDRYEEWGMMVWPDRGISAAVVGGKVKVIYYAASDQVKYATRDWTTERPKVTVPRDPGEDWDKGVTYGNLFISVSLGSNAPDGVNDNWKRSLETRSYEQITSTRSRRVVYSSRDTGSLSVSITYGKFNADGESDASVSMILTSTSPYGKFNSSGSASRHFKNVTRDRGLDLVDEAFADLERNTKLTAERQRPPSIESYRQRTLTDFERDLTTR